MNYPRNRKQLTGAPDQPLSTAAPSNSTHILKTTLWRCFTDFF